MSDLFSTEFFDSLTERQIAMLRVLLDHGGQLRRLAICDAMRQDYDVGITNDGLNGVIAGITKKHSEQAVDRIFRKRRTIDLGDRQTTFYMLSDECKQGLAEYAVNELGAYPGDYITHLDSWASEWE